MAWFLYLIECQDGSIYTGISNDVAKRYASHLAGTGAKYTRSHPPKKLLATMKFSNRSIASKAEYAVKSLSAKEKREFAELNSYFSKNMTRRFHLFFKLKVKS